MPLFFSRIGFPVIPAYPTFVYAQNTAAMTPMSAPSTPATTMSTPSTPLTTAQQVQSILSGSIYSTPPVPEVTPRYGSPVEAAQALMATRRSQWTSMMGTLGGGSITEKQGIQQGLMQRERDIMGQLQRMGVPVSPMRFR